jgi:4-diphosphocytidyl-2-C-methyl-D-erythritol kinase
VVDEATTRATSKTRSVRAIAPAKINLSLEVLGRRKDGFHEIRTSALAVDLCDAIEVRATRTGEVRLSLAGPAATADVPADSTNLVCRAALAVLDEGRALGAIDAGAGVDLSLEKRIPSRAGLGGGSSDAAAAWLATAAVFGIDLSATVRDRALARLGSDCVFFAAAGATGHALCEGRGERVTPRTYPAPAIRIAIVTPDVECATAEVYRSFVPRPLGVRPTSGNDLEEACLRAFPGLAPWRRLLGGPGRWSLSGSGSSFFALFESDAEAKAALEDVRHAAREADLALRGSWVVRTAGHGAKLLGTS